MLKGKDITRHPLEVEGQAVNVYTRTPPIMCIRADLGGRLLTVKGIETFHAGDWICTDFPPTTRGSSTPSPSPRTRAARDAADNKIVFPVAEADDEVEHTRYRGVGRAHPPAPVADEHSDMRSPREGDRRGRHARGGRERPPRPAVPLAPADEGDPAPAEPPEGGVAAQGEATQVSAIVTLDIEQLHWAYYVGFQRVENADRLGLRPRFPYKDAQDKLKKHTYGALGELVMAVFLGLRWTPGLEDFR